MAQSWLVLLEEEWAFSQLWIVLALVLVAVSSAQGVSSGPRASGSRAWPTSAALRIPGFAVAGVGLCGWLGWTC
jgi:hypothetical protein